MSHLHGSTSNGSPSIEKVPQELVHKHAAAEVLLTDWTTHGANRHTVWARWPHFHALYRSRDRHFDPLLFVETVRQTFPLLSHVAYGVPFGSHLVWNDFSFEVEPQAMLIPQSGAADVVLEITCSDVRMRKECLVSMTMHAAVRLNGRHIGVASTRFTSHSPAVYRRLRGQYDLGGGDRRALPLPPALPPAAVGHILRENVVLAEADADRWQLRVDQDHPVLFDHPVDHAPGMLLLEALRQAAHVVSPATGTTVTGMSVTFLGWVELDVPAWVCVAPLRRNALKAVIEQDGRTRLSGEVTLDTDPARTLELPSPMPSRLGTVDDHVIPDGCFAAVSERLG
ncbi:ScbA/BarX family gamma-butyrolactone biosynthesis protein [Streptomyces sp. NPDC001668]|uniref:ScbA/BarX family gamma-butyrolactone biosynthesis protein n=1 Tax=unclassified Streptomyces TaxID=2593676 RepID=UPI00368D3A3F